MSTDRASSVTRRATLQAAAALPLACAAGSVNAEAPPQPGDAVDRLRSRWVAMLTSAGGEDIRRSPYREIAQGVAANARRWLDTIVRPRDDPAALWVDPPAGAGEFNSRISIDRLRVIALAWATPGTALSGNGELEDLLRAALDWFERRRYNTTIAQTGNWWEWEIGIPLALTDLLLILHTPLMQSAPALRDRLSAAIARFTSDPTKGTGANRVWRAHIVMLNAIVTGDASRLAAARDAIPPTFAAVAEGDGFHADGSFIQHRDLSYNGGYGYELLIRASLLIYLLDGSDWRFARRDVAMLRGWVQTAFAPLMYRGALMDMTRGRNISRANVSDVKTGQVVIAAVLHLAAVLNDATLVGLVKGWIAGQRGAYDVFAYDPSLPAYWMTPHTAWLIRRAIADRRIPPAPDPVATVAFPNMTRFVHRRPRFTLAVAMNSRRISNFETINGENLTGWYTGWGMTTLYRPDRSNYADDFWPTVDPCRLPGVTLDRRDRPIGKPSGRNASDQVGALAFDGIGMAAMLNCADDDSFGARVAWYAVGDIVVCLGSGIRSTIERPVETVVANHKLTDRSPHCVVTVDGRVVDTPVGDRRMLTRAHWLHLPGHGGVAMLAPTDVHLLRDKRRGAWSDINRQDSSPRDVRTGKYLTLWLDHGRRPSAASYAYALLPGATAADTAAFAQADAVRIVTNGVDLHHLVIAERDGDVSAFTFWVAGRSADGSVASSAPLLVMLRRRGRQVDLGVVDPVVATQGTIALSIAQPGMTLIAHDPAMTVRSGDGAIHIDLMRAGLRGRTVRATWRLT